MMKRLPKVGETWTHPDWGTFTWQPETPSMWEKLRFQQLPYTDEPPATLYTGSADGMHFPIEQIAREFTFVPPPGSPSTQFVCRAQPHCRCSGEDACDCARNPQTNLCVDCFEPMEEVEFATGEAVKVAS